jgi:hypothetical protein
MNRTFLALFFLVAPAISWAVLIEIVTEDGEKRRLDRKCVPDGLDVGDVWVRDDDTRVTIIEITVLSEHDSEDPPTNLVPPPRAFGLGTFGSQTVVVPGEASSKQ